MSIIVNRLSRQRLFIGGNRYSMKAARDVDDIEAHLPRIRMTPVIFHILLALYERPSHGYGIMGQVRKMTNGEFSIGAGTLYRTVQKLILDGLIVEVGEPPHAETTDDRRRYYTLTASGTHVVRREAERIDRLATLSKKLGVIGP